MLRQITPAPVDIPQGLLHGFQDWVYKWGHVLDWQRGKSIMLKMHSFFLMKWVHMRTLCLSARCRTSTTLWFSQTTFWWSASNIRAGWFSKSHVVTKPWIPSCACWELPANLWVTYARLHNKYQCYTENFPSNILDEFSPGQQTWKCKKMLAVYTHSLTKRTMLYLSLSH